MSLLPRLREFRGDCTAVAYEKLVLQRELRDLPPPPLCRVRRGSVRLLLGNLDLRVGVGLFDELPATGPAEGPDNEREREGDVPGGDGQLLAEHGTAVAVAASVSPPRAATLAAWLTPTPPGVTETMFLAIEFPPITDITVWNVTAIP